MTIVQQKRLAEIRMSWLLSSVEFDTQLWESTLFLQLIDEQNQEINELRRKLKTFEK
jgi:hypothetical protein